MSRLFILNQIILPILAFDWPFIISLNQSQLMVSRGVWPEKISAYNYIIEQAILIRLYSFTFINSLNMFTEFPVWLVQESLCSKSL